MKRLSGRFMGTFNLAKGNKHKKNDNQKEGKDNLTSGNGISKIYHIFSNNSSAITASFQLNIANNISAVKIAESLVPRIDANQKTTKFEQTAENTLTWALVTTKDNQ